MIVNGKSMTTQDAMDMIHNREVDMWDKLKRGEIEPKIAIGGAAYTQKEWKHLIKHVDDVLEQNEKAQKEEIKKRDEEEAKKKEQNAAMLYEKMNQIPQSSMKKLLEL